MINNNNKGKLKVPGSSLGLYVYLLGLQNWTDNRKQKPVIAFNNK